VIGESVEDLVSCGGRDTIVESLTEILSEGVIVSAENVELLGEHVVKVISGDASFFHLSEEVHTHLVFLFFSNLADFVALVVKSLELGTHGLFGHTTEIALLNLEDNSAVSISLGVGKGVEHLLGERSSLVATTVGGVRSDGFNGLFVVLLEALLVLEESLVFGLVVSVILLLTGFMVGNINVLESTTLLFGKSHGDVVLDFSLVGTLSLVSVASLELEHLLELQLLKSKTSLPLFHVLSELFILVEGRGNELLSPERYMRCARSTVNVVYIGVINSHLVEPSQTERPHIVFLQTVVNSGIVGVRGVGVEGLSLDVVELEELIIVVHRDGVGDSDHVLLVRLVRLQTLVVIHLVEGDVIHILEDGGVVHNVIIETGEGVLKDGADTGSVNELLHADVETGIELVVRVLVMLAAVVNASGSVGASHSGVLTVPVDAPEVVHAAVDLFVVRKSGEDGRGE